MATHLNPKIKYPKNFTSIKPIKYVKFQKIPQSQYSSKYDIKTTLKNYNKHIIKYNIPKKTLVMCHGHLHPRYKYLQTFHSVLIDINPLCVPDIVGDITHNGFMQLFPQNYFDQIYLLYTPPPTPLAPRNKFIWTNIHRMLKPNGILKSKYIITHYSRKFHNSKYKLFISKYFKNLFHISFHGQWTFLTKK